MNTLSAAPTVARHFAAKLPESVAQPKFELFQRVRGAKGWQKEREFTIIGLHWIDHNTALMEKLNPGWHYALSYIYGITDAADLLSRDPSTTFMGEVDLVAIAP